MTDTCDISTLKKADTEQSVRRQLSEIRNRLDQAVSIAKAAEICVTAGNLPKALEIAVDIDQLLYEITTLFVASKPRQPKAT